MEAAVRPETQNDAAAKLPRVGSAVVVLDGDRVLLGVRAKEPNRGRWILPGGKIRPFESIDEAAAREIREETGLRIVVERQLGVREIIEPPDEHRLIVYSIARPIGGELRASSDLSEARFCHLEELDALDLTETVRAVLTDFTSSVTAEPPASTAVNRLIARRYAATRVRWRNAAVAVTRVLARS